MGRDRSFNRLWIFYRCLICVCCVAALASALYCLQRLQLRLQSRPLIEQYQDPKSRSSSPASAEAGPSIQETVKKDQNYIHGKASDPHDQGLKKKYGSLIPKARIRADLCFVTAVVVLLSTSLTS